MSNQHTQGPWKFGRVGKNTQHIDGGRWFGLCKVFVLVDGERSKEGEANARLIAAAPELLEALEQVVSEHGARYLNGADDSLMPSHRQLPAIRNAMEVIAKARGQ